MAKKSLKKQLAKQRIQSKLKKRTTNNNMPYLKGMISTYNGASQEQITSISSNFEKDYYYEH